MIQSLLQLLNLLLWLNVQLLYILTREREKILRREYIICPSGMNWAFFHDFVWLAIIGFSLGQQSLSGQQLDSSSSTNTSLTEIDTLASNHKMKWTEDTKRNLDFSILFFCQAFHVQRDSGLLIFSYKIMFTLSQETESEKDFPFVERIERNQESREDRHDMKHRRIKHRSLAPRFFLQNR